MTKQRTVHTSFTKKNLHLYDKLNKESEETGLKLSTIVTKSLELYFNAK